MATLFCDRRPRKFTALMHHYHSLFKICLRPCMPMMAWGWQRLRLHTLSVYLSSNALIKRLASITRWRWPIPKLSRQRESNVASMLAWALQHEIDHLDGILYLDRLDRPEDLREVRPDDSAEEEALVE